jgi:hypothetical protein
MVVAMSASLAFVAAAIACFAGSCEAIPRPL